MPTKMRRNDSLENLSAWFFLAVVTNFSLNLTFSFFLKTLGSENLPIYYITLNLLSISLAIFINKMEIKARKWLIQVSFAGASGFCLFSLLPVENSRILLFCAYLFMGLFNIYSFTLLWNLINSLLGIQEMKTCVSKVIASHCAGAVFAGMITHPLLQVASFSTALVFCACNCLIIALYTLSFPADDSSETTESKEKIPLSRILQPWLVKLILSMTFLIGFSRILVDYQFSRMLETIFASPQELASFNGLFTSILRAAVLLFSMIASVRLLGLFSPNRLISIASVICLSFCLLFLILPSAHTAIAMQFTFLFLFNIIFIPLGNIFFSVLTSQIQARARFFNDGLIYCLSILISALLIILIQYFQFPLFAITILAILGFTLHFLVTLRLEPAYLSAIRFNLLSNNSDTEPLIYSLRSPSSIQSYLQEIQDDKTYRENTVFIQSIYQLIQHESQKSDELIREIFITSQATDTLLEMIKTLSLHKKIRLISDLLEKKFLLFEKENRIPAFLNALAISCDPCILGWFERMLENADTKTKAYSAVGILKLSDEEEKIKDVLFRLLSWKNSKKEEERALAIEIMGEIGLHCFHKNLILAMKDPSLMVRKTAVYTCYKNYSKDFLDTLQEIENLKSNESIKTLIAKAIVEQSETVYLKVEKRLQNMRPDQRKRLIEYFRRILNQEQMVLATRLLEIENNHLCLIAVEFATRKIKTQAIFSFLQSTHPKNLFTGELFSFILKHETPREFVEFLERIQRFYDLKPVLKTCFSELQKSGVHNPLLSWSIILGCLSGASMMKRDWTESKNAMKTDKISAGLYTEVISSQIQSSQITNFYKSLLESEK